MRLKIKDYLVRRQTGFWEFLRTIPFSSSPTPPKLKPVITVSREPGSGGRPIAKQVAKELGFDFYDKKLLRLIARDARRKKELVKELDEDFKTVIEEFFASLSKESYISRSTYYKSLCRVVFRIARRGKAVILGRGANFILPPSDVLRVRIIAPLKVRIQNAIRYEGHHPEKAREVIRKYHFARKEFVKRTFGKNISNANYYDLVINTEHLTIPQAVQIIKAAFKQKFG